MSKHSSIFPVSIPTREQQTNADKMVFPQPKPGETGREKRRKHGKTEKSTNMEVEGLDLGVTDLANTQIYIYMCILDLYTYIYNIRRE